MKKFSRRTFVQWGGAVGAAVSTATIAEAAEAAMSAKHNRAIDQAPSLAPQHRDTSPAAQPQEHAPRSSVSAEETISLPFGVWIGLGNNRGGHGVTEVDYVGYCRFYLSEASQIVGRNGFYRITTTLQFPRRKQGALSANHLLVFDSDFIDPNMVKPLATFPLPTKICAPATSKTPVQIRDVCMDLHGGLCGNWRDEDFLFSRRIKAAFQQEAMAGV